MDRKQPSLFFMLLRKEEQKQEEKYILRADILFTALMLEGVLGLIDISFYNDDAHNSLLHV